MHLGLIDEHADNKGFPYHKRTTTTIRRVSSTHKPHLVAGALRMVVATPLVYSYRTRVLATRDASPVQFALFRSDSLCFGEKKVGAHILAFSYWVLRITTDKKRLEMRFKEE